MAFVLLNKGELARGGGWLARAQRVLDDGQHDCVERGYLLMPMGIACMRAGDTATAHETFDAAAQVADRFGDPDLVALSRHGRGRSLVRLGKTAEGVALLDEVMVSVTGGEVSAMVAGVVYCSVLEACQEIFDMRRALEWTAALTRWCASRPPGPRDGRGCASGIGRRAGLAPGASARPPGHGCLAPCYRSTHDQDAGRAGRGDRLRLPRRCTIGSREPDGF